MSTTMILPGEEPLGMVCDGPAPTFFIIGMRGHRHSLWGHTGTHGNHNPLI